MRKQCSILRNPRRSQFTVKVPTSSGTTSLERIPQDMDYVRVLAADITIVLILDLAFSLPFSGLVDLQSISVR